MWAKFGKQLFDLWQTNKNQPQTQLSPEEEAKQVMQTALKEIETAIQKHKTTINQTTVNQKELGQQLQQHRQAADRLYQQAMQAVKQKNDAVAQTLLNQKALEDQQVTQYLALYENITKVVLQLEGQLNKMQLQLQELKSREVVMTARMQNAKTQKELTECLQELDITLQDGFDKELLRTEMEAELINGISESDKVLADTQGQFLLQQEMAKLEKELKETEEKERQRKEANQLKRLEQLFGVSSDKEKQQAEEAKKEAERKRKALAQEIFDNQKEKEIADQQKHKQLASFFEEKQPEKEKQVAITPQKEDKTSLLDSFFSTPPSKEQNEKDKLLDNFFKD